LKVEGSGFRLQALGFGIDLDCRTEHIRHVIYGRGRGPVVGVVGGAQADATLLRV